MANEQSLDIPYPFPREICQWDAVWVKYGEMARQFAVAAVRLGLVGE